LVSVLQFLGLFRLWLLRSVCFGRISRVWHNQLLVCDTGRIYDRHVRQKKPAAHDVSADVVCTNQSAEGQKTETFSLFLLYTGLSFLIDAETNKNARVGNIAAGIYLFGMVYSPGGKRGRYMRQPHSVLTNRFRGPCAIHVFSRGISAIHTSHRNVPCHRNNMVLQFRPLNHLAKFARGVLTNRSLWLVRSMEYRRLVAYSPLLAVS